MISHILPLPRPPYCHQGASYLLQHLTGVETPLPYCNKFSKKANNGGDIKNKETSSE